MADVNGFSKGKRSVGIVNLEDPGHGSRILEIDGLRGLGSVAIVSSHLWPSTVFFGWTRVDLFFVLSGYLITSIILKHSEHRHFLGRFWIRRALRTWPIYYLAVLGVCTSVLFARGIVGKEALLFHLAFIQNLPYYFSGRAYSIHSSLTHTWALAIEEQFYFLWPILILMVGRSLLIPMIIFVTANSVVARVVGLHPWTLVARCDGLGLGSFLAVLFVREIPPFPSKIRLISLGAVAALAMAYLSYDVIISSPEIPSYARPITIFAVNALFFGLVGLTIHHAGQAVVSPLRNAVLRYLGQISYGVYIFHMIIISCYLGFVPTLRRSYLTDLIAFILCFAAGAVSWEIFEKPLSNLKRRWPYT